MDMWLIVVLIVVIAIAAVAMIMTAPDIARYLRMRRI
jgi:predicted membrane channel-forming protein YqfA (hemolysin III family)